MKIYGHVHNEISKKIGHSSLLLPNDIQTPISERPRTISISVATHHVRVRAPRYGLGLSNPLCGKSIFASELRIDSRSAWNSDT
jgi:hypothetical protein